MTVPSADPVAKKGLELLHAMDVIGLDDTNDSDVSWTQSLLSSGIPTSHNET